MPGSPLGHFSWLSALRHWEWLCKAVAAVLLEIVLRTSGSDSQGLFTVQKSQAAPPTSRVSREWRPDIIGPGYWNSSVRFHLSSVRPDGPPVPVFYLIGCADRIESVGHSLATRTK